MASTYPLEVIQADRWIKANKNLKGEALKEAADKEPWDESVKSLAASPDVLSMMSSKLEWTLMLGDAVLAQQPDVMDAIQRLRSRADANNKLTSTKEQRVTKTQSQSGRQFIAIEQTNPETLYVPYYDPAVAYGSWPYPAYPPYYFGYPGYIGAGLIATGLAFGAGWALGRWASGGNYWGGGINWNNNINNININRPRVNPLNGNNWQHRPEHRQGVRYNNSNVRQQFGNNNIRGGAQNRTDFRGRPSAGQRPGAGSGPPGGLAQDSGPPGGLAQDSGPPGGRAPGSAPPGGRAPGSAPPGGRAPGSAPQGGQAQVNGLLEGMAAVMPLVISGLVGLPTFRVPAAARASAVAVSVVVAAADSGAVVAAGDQISGLSTTSFCSVIFPTGLATIASATTAVIAPMSV